ncbi:MAG: hypothetical protein J2P37_28705 [Ktedonobacteraceae bacterium]|nr:hypothetical protein [Ktedonobacteraceae bacterium]
MTTAFLHLPMAYPDRSRRTTAQRVGGYAEALRRRRRFLANMTIIYRDEWTLSTRQVEACLSLLSEMRQVVLATQAYLHSLEPGKTKLLRPYACVTKLADLDYLLTEVLLYCTVFHKICETTGSERVQLHLTIRALFPLVLTSYDDTHSMLAALAAVVTEQETTMIQRQQEERCHDEE